MAGDVSYRWMVFVSYRRHHKNICSALSCHCQAFVIQLLSLSFSSCSHLVQAAIGVSCIKVITWLVIMELSWNTSSCFHRYACVSMFSEAWQTKEEYCLSTDDRMPLWYGSQILSNAYSLMSQRLTLQYYFSCFRTAWPDISVCSKHFSITPKKAV